jgi:hypothetical protein
MQTQTQQLMWQGRTEELPTSSKQQPGSSAGRRPMGIQAGLAAVTLAALAYCLVLSYGAASALVTRTGYTEMALRQEIEDLHAQVALLNHQVHVAKSDPSVQEAAEQLSMRPVDPVTEVDYVLLPYSEPAGQTQVAAAGRTDMPARVAAALAELVTEVLDSSEGRAEASMVEGHRP